MPTTEIDINAPASAVYDSLIDAWTYEVWVKGAKNIRAVDPTWPAPGSRFHHSVGIGPLMTRDQTRLVRSEPDRLVELNIQLWPIGEGIVRLELAETGARTHVTMHEEFTQGPAAWADNALQQVAMKLRNDWSLDKLRDVVEQRYRMQR
jgi:hypothetical protein